MHRIPVLSSLIVLLIVSTTSAAPPQYAVIDLGHDAAVIAVDPQGNGVGSWQGQAALFTLNGTHGLLGSLPNGSSSVATNRDGIHGSVGFSATIPDTSIGQEGTHAFYRFNGIMHDLGTFQGNPFSFASALNSTIAVGWGGATGVDGSVPLSWRLKGGPAVRLATLGGPTGFVHALRPSGVAVGSSDTKQGELHATLWLMAVPSDLTPGTGIVSEAYAVNMSLMIVGDIMQNNKQSGFRWTSQRGLEKVGTLPGHFQSTLTGVNIAGTAVGQSIGPGNFPLGAVAIRCGPNRCIDLNTVVQAPGWVLENACCINDQGVIGGQGQRNGQLRAFLLRPLPLTVAHQ